MIISKLLALETFMEIECLRNAVSIFFMRKEWIIMHVTETKTVKLFDSLDFRKPEKTATVIGRYVWAETNSVMLDQLKVWEQVKAKTKLIALN